MRLCFPITEDLGIESPLYGHFSSAPMFLIVDTESKQTEAVLNCDPKDPFTGCSPFNALKSLEIDAIIVEGLGDNALQAMHLAGFKVYEAKSTSLVDNLNMYKSEELQESVRQNSAAAGRCGDEEGEGSCDHDHEHDH